MKYESAAVGIGKGIYEFMFHAMHRYIEDCDLGSRSVVE